MEETRHLVLRAADATGDQDSRLQAFGQLVVRYQDMAYGYAYAILGDFHLAEDASQEAFVTAYQQLANLHQPVAFAGWLRRIVHTSCTRLLRRRDGATAPLEAAMDVTSPTEGPGETLEAKELHQEVLRAIRALPEAEREVTTLFYINGYSQQEVADFLEVPVTTVNNRLHASRERLKERMITMAKDALKNNRLPQSFAQGVLSVITAGHWHEDGGVLAVDNQNLDFHKVCGRWFDDPLAEEPLAISKERYPAEGVICEFDVRVTGGSQDFKVVFGPYPYPSLKPGCPDGQLPIALNPKAGGTLPCVLFRLQLSARKGDFGDAFRHYDCSYTNMKGGQWVHARAELIRPYTRILLDGHVVLEARFDDIGWDEVNVALGAMWNTRAEFRDVVIRPANQDERRQGAGWLKRTVCIDGRGAPVYMPPAPTPVDPDSAAVPLTSLPLTRVIGAVQIDRSPACLPIRIDGVDHARGFGLMGRASAAWSLGGAYLRLSGQAAPDLTRYRDITPGFEGRTRKAPDQLPPLDMVFRGDGRELYRRKSITLKDESFSFDLDVSGVDELVVLAECCTMNACLIPPLVVGSPMLGK